MDKEITIKYINDELTEIYFGDVLICYADYDSLGSCGMIACENLAKTFAEQLNLKVVEE